MAAANLLTLIDDIASILDDVALFTKVAAKKSAGVLGDDLALNAQQVAGVRPNRELPVVWAVAKGSALNKLILIPAALIISAVVPWLITPLLMLGGLFLCYEGVEKLLHSFHAKDKKDAEHHRQHLAALQTSKEDLLALEKQKIKGAIRTDFILSAEIIVITLGTVAAASFLTQVSVLTLIGAAMTVGVYGLVAGIVKLDDLGLYLSNLEPDNALDRFLIGLGKLILKAAPYMMKTLSIVGTAAMFLVGGGILVHGIPGLESWLHDVLEGMGGIMAALLPMLFNAVIGIIAGGIAVALMALLKNVVGFFPGLKQDSSPNKA